MDLACEQCGEPLDNMCYIDLWQDDGWKAAHREVPFYALPREMKAAIIDWCVERESESRWRPFCWNGFWMGISTDLRWCGKYCARQSEDYDGSYEG